MTITTIELTDTSGQAFGLSHPQMMRLFSQWLQTQAVVLPAQADELMTGEDLFALGDIGRTELVKGGLVYLMPTGFRHDIIEVRMTTQLNNFVNEQGLGYVFGGETGIYTARNPDTVRGVDAAYISLERFAQIQSASYLDVAPELVVEVMSPDDSWTRLNDKLNEYFEMGVCQVWVINPQRQQVQVYSSLTDLVILNVAGRLTGGDVLPGFDMPVAGLFSC